MNYGLNFWEYTLYIAFPLLTIGLLWWAYLFIYWFKGNDLSEKLGDDTDGEINLIKLLFGIVVLSWIIPAIAPIVIPCGIVSILIYKGIGWIFKTRNKNYDKKHGNEDYESRNLFDL